MLDRFLNVKICIKNYMETLKLPSLWTHLLNKYVLQKMSDWKEITLFILKGQNFYFAPISMENMILFSWWKLFFLLFLFLFVCVCSISVFKMLRFNVHIAYKLEWIFKNTCYRLWTIHPWMLQPMQTTKSLPYIFYNIQIRCSLHHNIEEKVCQYLGFIETVLWPFLYKEIV